MSKKSILGTALTGTATALIVLGMSGPAQAADTQIYSHDTSGNVLGTIRHYDDGDRFGVTDLYPDGHGVRGYLLNAGQTLVLNSVYNGNGDEGAQTSFTYDIKSGTNYVMMICIVDGSSDNTGQRCGSKTITE
ncbi:hypothetical protein AB0I28_15300 [Phytomonospora sp. NPDC050363]|uniref:hypothetical protein n=1 Tax=Phytomonospora sp. NPDC050363 TaxID=3155642 RepID=UPI0033C7F4FE